jgi:pimeloyl-ACP methyl ester carboxylesterase
MDPLRHVARLKRSAELHASPCGSGELEWQHWSSDSEAKPLVLLHGGFGSWTHWIKNIPELREHFDLWSLDLPGLGVSADMPEPHTVEHFARVILAGINQHLGGQASFSLAGFSFGALIGARLAQLAGSRCETLLVCGAAGFGELHRQVELLRPPGPEISIDGARCIHRNNLRSLMFSSNDCIDELALYVHGENLSRARFNSRRVSRTDEFVQTLPSIKARLVGIWGSRDVTAGGRRDIEKRQQLLSTDRENTEFHILDGVGHWAMYEGAEQFNRLGIAAL